MISEINTEIIHKEDCECETCSICLSPKRQEEYICPYCNKKFHLICIIKWLNESNTCPMCRKEIKRVRFSDKIYRFRNFNNFNQIIRTEDVINEHRIRCCENIDYDNLCRWVCSISFSMLIILLLIAIITSKI